MLAVHGIWARGALCVWAEDAARHDPHPPREVLPRRGRTSPPHPFASDAGTLAGHLALASELLADLVRKATYRDLKLWLPSAGEAPLPSPELAQAQTQARRPGRPRLAAWQMQALAFEPAAALEVLAALCELTRSADAEALGASVHYLAAVAGMAADLVGRGQVLPTLTREDGTFAARWRPVLAGADAERARELARAIPPVCRATAREGEASAGILAEMLDAITDAAARAALGAGVREPGVREPGVPEPGVPEPRAHEPRAHEPADLLPPRRGRASRHVPVTERWIAALTAADPRITPAGPEEETEAAKLASALEEWRAAAQVPSGPVRTSFRLIEPAPAEGPPESQEAQESPPAPWRVEFALQSTSDPSLVIPAADIWAGLEPAGSAAPVTGIRHAEEELLAGLGRAARLFPELDAELSAAAPANIAMDAAGAYRFVKETAPLLSGAGFGVLLPAWARKTRLGLKLTTRTKRASNQAVTGSGFGLEDLVEFRYDIAVGDRALDPDELAELARLKVPLVRLRGQWVELDQRQLQAALRFMERNRPGEMRAGDALAAGLRGAEDAGEVPLVEVDADGWLGDLLSGQADRRLEPAGTPGTFRGELRPYQRRGLAWLSFLAGLGLGGVLADDMGLGKTVQLLALLAAERCQAPSAPPQEVEVPTVDGALRAAVMDPVIPPTLLICPMSLVGNWQREAERFTPHLNVHVHHGSQRLAGEALAGALKSADLVITTYALAARDREALSGIGWGRIVCDEAQNIKNSATKQAQAIRALPAASKIALTGTPVENRLSELWSIMEFANPGLLGSAQKFRTSFAIPIERHGDEEATAALKRLTGPFVLRRLKTDRSIISDLPDKLEMKIWCNMTAEQASLYQATVEDMLARIEGAEEGIERRGLVLATMAKLKQVCNHPAHLLGDGSRLGGRSGKLARLEEICDEVLAEGDKALCFTQYAEFGAMLQPYLAARLGFPVLFLHGGTPKRRRDALVAQFQDSTEPAVFLLSLKAGGTGLNLTAASHVIHVDRWWNPAVENQATDRAFRIGQRKDVQVRKFVCVGTLEERIDRMIEEKQALAERIVGTGESWLTELSVAELREVIALSPEAVSE
jgi:SNF2 family DNA or RNA helicase